ncbi:MAG: hypothetical protein P8Z71_03985 [Candidatus Sulfobium sp.]
MAVNPALGMDYVAYTMADAAHLEAALGQFFLARIDLTLIGYQELDIVPGGETKMPVAVFIRNVAYLADVIGSHDPGCCHPDGPKLVSAFGHMNHGAVRKYLVVFPLAVVLLYYRRHELMKIGRTYVCFSLW